MIANSRYSFAGLLLMAALIFGVGMRSDAADQPLKRISPDETHSYTNVSQKVIVTGQVVEVFETDKAIHLNFGKARPDQTFTVLIYAYKASSFPGLKEMKGKTIEVTGSVSVSYEGKPIMYMTQPKDLNVLPAKE